MAREKLDRSFLALESMTIAYSSSVTLCQKVYNVYKSEVTHKVTVWILSSCPVQINYSRQVDGGSYGYLHEYMCIHLGTTFET